MPPVGKAHALQHLRGAPLPLARAHAGVDEGQFHVFLRVQPGKKLRVLEDKADLFPAQIRQIQFVQFLDALAVEYVFALGGHVQAADDVHQRALAAARGAKHGQILAALDIQVDAAQDGHVLVGEAVALADALHVEEFFCHTLTAYMPPGKPPPPSLPPPPPKLLISGISPPKSMLPPLGISPPGIPPPPPKRLESRPPPALVCVSSRT